MLKLARRARGHFVTLIEIRVHLLRVKPGHISKILTIPLTNSRQIDLSEPHNALYFVRIEKVSAIVR